MHRAAPFWWPALETSGRSRATQLSSQCFQPKLGSLMRRGSQKGIWDHCKVKRPQPWRQNKAPSKHLSGLVRYFYHMVTTLTNQQQIITRINSFAIETGGHNWHDISYQILRLSNHIISYLIMICWYELTHQQDEAQSRRVCLEWTPGHCSSAKARAFSRCCWLPTSCRTPMM